MPDGRVLGFAEYGDPKGNALFYFHGTPNSRLGGRWTHRHALERGIRVIAPDRPGYGLSTFQPNRRIVDWPADIQSLAHHLGLQQYAVIGWSGRGPHALACARMIPDSILTQVGLVASAVPWCATGMYGRRIIVYLKTWLFGALFDYLKWDEWVTSWGNEVRAGVVRDYPPFVSPYWRKRLNGMSIAIARGTAQGAGTWRQDVELFGGNWGFALEDVQHRNIKCWHGVRDPGCPIGHIRTMAERLPHCRLEECDRKHEDMGREMTHVMDAFQLKDKPS